MHCHKWMCKCRGSLLVAIRRVPSGGLQHSDAGDAAARDGAPGASPLGAAVAPMTLLEGRENEVELEKSNVLLLGPTGAAGRAGCCSEGPSAGPSDVHGGGPGVYGRRRAGCLLPETVG